MSDGGNAPSWLFSFVDLAFLLLIAMTQLANDASGPDLGDIVVPQIESAVAKPGATGVADVWQLRIHPPSDAAPFELSLGGMTDPDAAFEARVDLSDLRARLGEIQTRGQRKPLLAPHADSRSQDLLDAVSALETLWPGKRRAAVAPLVANR